MNFETTIFNNLLYNEQYSRKVIPFLKPDYFSDSNEKTIYNIIDTYVKTYNNIPNKEALLIELSNLNVSQDSYTQCKQYIESLTPSISVDNDWLYDKTEKFCQEKAVYNAIMESIHILDNKNEKKSKGMIPQLLSDALAVSFDTHIGHDLFEDHMARFDFYHTKEVKIPFDLEYFNAITKGGLSRKTLTVILAGCVHPDTKVNVRLKKKE